MNKIGLIVASHDELAESLIRTTETILGRKTLLHPFTFRDGEDPRDSMKRLRSLVKKCDQGHGVVVMVDLFGGTPGTLALSMLDEKLVEVATGVNLPMTLAATTLKPELSLKQACQSIVAAGREAIKEAGTLLKG